MNIIQLNDEPWTYEQAKASGLYDAQNVTFENQIFTWKSWDQLGTACFAFSDCVLVAPLGQFSIGEKFSSIVVDYERSLLTVTKPEWAYDHDETGHKVKEIYFSMLVSDIED